MSTGVKALIAVVVVGGLLYWYYMSSTPVPANAPNGAGSLPPPDNTTSGGSVASTTPVGTYSNPPLAPGTPLSPTAASGGTNTTLGPQSVGTLFGIKVPTPGITNATANPGPATYIPALIKRVPSLAGTNALSVNPSTGYVLASATGPGTDAYAIRHPTGAGAAGTSSTGYVAPGQSAPGFPAKV